MSTTIRKMLGLFSFTVFFSIWGYSQQVEKMTIEGTEYFIYPFKMDVRMHGDYWGILKQTRQETISYAEYKREWAAEFGYGTSRSEYRDFREFMDEMNGFDRERKKYLNRKWIKAARRNPYPLLEQRMIENVDVIPSLDPIPDGKYVQLYEDFCFTDEKGNCMQDKQFIAGFFSIKNNMLHGEATWVDLKGDTLKHGWFNNGLKEGKWTLMSRESEYALTPKDAKMYIEQGKIDCDTLREYSEYSQGAKNGKFVRYFSSQYPTQEGYYSNGEMTGEWIFRNITFKGIGPFRKRIRNNEKISLRYTLNDNDSLIAHGPWIRKDKISFYGADEKQFNFMYELSLDELPTLYKIAFEKRPEVDVEEEELSLNEMDEMMRSYELNERRYDQYGYGDRTLGYYQPGHYDQKSGRTIKRGVLLDSLGGIPNYTGVYEKYYANGQLMMKFDFEEGGALVDQGTIYWDNGVVHDKIEFVSDSNHYLRSVYDYDGKLFVELSYDSLGDFKEVVKEYEMPKTAVLDGLTAMEASYGKYYIYDKLDTLSNDLTEPLVIFRSWAKEDSTRLYNSVYDPIERKVINNDYSFSGKEVKTYTSAFAENFESWTGKSSYRYQGLELSVTNSGTLYEGVESDSIPQMNIPRMHNIFDVASEFVLIKEGNPYTGAVEIDFSAKKLSIPKKGMNLQLPMAESKSKKLFKDAEKYRLTGTTKYPEILDYFDYSDLNRGKGTIIFNEFFNQLLGGFFNAYGGYDSEYSEGRSKSRYPELDRLEGQMLNGKPEGIWTSYDQFGKKMTEVPFANGEANGRVKYFGYAYPKNESEDYYYEYGDDFGLDSFPTKRKYYLNVVADFKNGFLDGKEIEYNWYGDVVSEFNYVEGRRDGPGIERNAIAFTKSYFQNGMLDGYVQTYLTLPQRDSILLFDLNFQDGMLQGESKSYHTNGKISKRGFFLNGDPIEDYEAFDSLGVKYHYVKFKYSFPVEEKIWEENELSVRYLFNWEDSIYFEPSDITTSQSLEEVMYDLGFGYEYMEQPYYGRPSLVDKTGIKYHMTKYYPNDTIARDGAMDRGRKVGCWKYFSYEGKPLYEVDYFDTLVKLNDSIEFFSRGVYTELNAQGKVLSESYIIEKSEKYDCSHSDHYEIRQFHTIWEDNDSTHRMNGYVRNYYDNGTLQSEGEMKDGLPTGFWKYYDPFGKLNKYGQYTLGKRDGRWLSGDLSKTKYLGDICLNPNLPDLEKEIRYRENLLDITIISYSKGKVINRQYYDVNMNRFTEFDDEEQEEPSESEELLNDLEETEMIEE